MKQQLFPDRALIVPTPAPHPPPKPTTAACSRETGKRFPSAPSLTSFSCSAACLAASKGKMQLWRWIWSHTLRFPPLGGDQLPSCLSSVSPSAVSDTPWTCVSALPVKQGVEEQCRGEGMLPFPTCCCYLHKKKKIQHLHFYFFFFLLFLPWSQAYKSGQRIIKSYWASRLGTKPRRTLKYWKAL